MRPHRGWRGLIGQLGRPAALSTYKDATPLAAFLFLLHLSFTPRPPFRTSLGLRPSSPTIADRRAVIVREAFLSVHLHTHRRPLIAPPSPRELSPALVGPVMSEDGSEWQGPPLLFAASCLHTAAAAAQLKRRWFQFGAS